LTGTNMDDALCSVFVAFLLWRVEARVPLPDINMLGGSMFSQIAEALSRHGNLRVTLGLLNSKPLHYVMEDEA
jgi:hypothetical protein